MVDMVMDGDWTPENWYTLKHTPTWHNPDDYPEFSSGFLFFL
jgi:hypothetical protein